MCNLAQVLLQLVSLVGPSDGVSRQSSKDWAAVCSTKFGIIITARLPTTDVGSQDTTHIVTKSTTTLGTKFERHPIAWASTAGDSAIVSS